jgi:hypothetical protein
MLRKVPGSPLGEKFPACVRCFTFCFFATRQNPFCSDLGCTGSGSMKELEWRTLGFVDQDSRLGPTFTRKTRNDQT